MTREKIARLRERFMQEDVGHRLGHLASNLAHIASFSDRVEHKDVVADMIEESQWFIEWIAPSLADARQQEQLIDLQVQLARWKRELSQQLTDAEWRARFIEATRKLSTEILEQSGLLAT